MMEKIHFVEHLKISIETLSSVEFWTLKKLLECSSKEIEIFRAVKIYLIEKFIWMI